MQNLVAKIVINSQCTMHKTLLFLLKNLKMYVLRGRGWSKMVVPHLHSRVENLLEACLNIGILGLSFRLVSRIFIKELKFR